MDIRAARKQLGWSRADLADRAGVDRRVLQLIELGLSEDHDAILRCEEVLAAAIGVPSAGAPGAGRAEDA